MWWPQVPTQTPPRPWIPLATGQARRTDGASGQRFKSSQQNDLGRSLIIAVFDRDARTGEQLPRIVSEDLWARIEPLLLVVPRRADHPGRERLDDRKVLCGILFVQNTGIPWEFLPQELGFGSGMTAWRRLRASDRPARCPHLCTPWRRRPG